MLVLFETAAGFALFKLLDENKLNEVDDLYRDFESPEAASRVVKLKHFEKFYDTTDALAATTAIVEGKLSKSLKKVLKQHISEEVQEQLLVADSKLGSAIKKKFNVKCLSNNAVQELMRGIRNQLENLITGLTKKENFAMTLGLAHSLARYKLKFTPDKVDTMIVQAVCVLDHLDKQINNYVMRLREWYGWHFPELTRVLTDNVLYVKAVRLMGNKCNAVTTDFSDILPDNVEHDVKEAAELSMGTDMSEDDIDCIQGLCTEITEFMDYRVHLFDYLRNRMMAMAPNLAVLVGELVGARLISHAGSLTNLAKYPASTVQILGAEKALFRALKTRKDTPKYGLIYHAQLIGQTSLKNKGKMSRMLAAKASLAIRVDALGENNASIKLGTEHRAKLEAKLRILEQGNLSRLSGTGKAKARFEKYQSKSVVQQYPSAADSTIPSAGKRKWSESGEPSYNTEPGVSGEASQTSKQKKKKVKQEFADVDIKKEVQEELEVLAAQISVSKIEKKKKKKQSMESASSIVAEAGPSEEVIPTPKQKKAKEERTPVGVEQLTETTEEAKPEKKKKKKRSMEAVESNVEAELTQEQVESESPRSEKKKKKKRSMECTESTVALEVSIETTQPETPKPEKKKKKKSKEPIESQFESQVTEQTEPGTSTSEKKKKKKHSTENIESAEAQTAEELDQSGIKEKKKKKQKALEEM